LALERLQVWLDCLKNGLLYRIAVTTSFNVPTDDREKLLLTKWLSRWRGGYWRSIVND
jgi:hypothetical protein